MQKRRLVSLAALVCALGATEVRGGDTIKFSGHIAFVVPCAEADCSGNEYAAGFVNFIDSSLARPMHDRGDTHETEIRLKDKAFFDENASSKYRYSQGQYYWPIPVEKGTLTLEFQAPPNGKLAFAADLAIVRMDWFGAKKPHPERNLKDIAQLTVEIKDGKLAIEDEGRVRFERIDNGKRTLCTDYDGNAVGHTVVFLPRGDLKKISWATAGGNGHITLASRDVEVRILHRTRSTAQLAEHFREFYSLWKGNDGYDKPMGERCYPEHASPSVAVESHHSSSRLLVIPDLGGAFCPPVLLQRYP